ncbi:holin [Streptomyces griseoviridis]
MPRRAAWRVCNEHGCPEYTQHTKCDEHRSAAEQRRGSARQRGYDRAHETTFRAAVLARDPQCVLCHAAPSKHADHWPIDRRELVRRGDDPNDPQHGRGLCGPCHSTETAREQPGGWNR